MANWISLSEASEKLDVPVRRLRHGVMVQKIPSDQLYPGAQLEISAEWVEKTAARRAGGSEEEEV